MHLPCCDGSCFLRIHVKNIFIGNAESNISKVLYKSICLQQKKKKPNQKSHLRLSSIDLSIDIGMANFILYWYISDWELYKEIEERKKKTLKLKQFFLTYFMIVYSQNIKSKFKKGFMDYLFTAQHSKWL